MQQGKTSIFNLTDEIFTQEFTFASDIKVFINFKINNIEKIMANLNPIKNLRHINIDFFVKNNSIIVWNPVSTKNTKKQSVNNHPIYLVPFLDGIHEWLVIDGNYKLSNFLLTNLKTIEGFFIQQKELLEYNSFCSDFDKYLYIFFNEIQLLATYRIKLKFSDKEVLKKSFLKNNNFNFDPLII